MIRRCVLALLFITGCISAFDENSMLTSIMVKAGSRGLAIVVESDGPAVESYQSALQGNQTVLRIFLKNVVYGLDDFSFSKFPEDAPVKEIHAREEMDGSLILTAIFRKQFYTKTKAKRVDNRNIFLVSSEPFSPYTWNSSSVKKPSTTRSVSVQPAKTPEKPAVLTSIRLLKRGDVEQLVISADNPVRIKTRSKYGMIIAVFENVINGLNATSYSIPSSSLIKKVTIVESKRGSNRVGVRIETMSASDHSSFVEVKPKQCIVYAMPQQASTGSRGLALWTHDGQVNASYNFIKASTLKSVTGLSMSVGATKSEPKKRLVVIRDNVNFRMEPVSDSPDNIIMTLRMGAEATEIKKQGGWYYIKVDGSNTEGWIYSTLVTEKSQLTQAQREAINRAQGVVPAIPAPPKVDESTTPKTIEKVPAVPQPDKTAAPVEGKETQKEEKRVTRYRQYGRDPFLPLNQADFLQSELLKVESCALVGILYDRLDRVALLEDNSKGGEAFSIRERDAISNGRVLKIRDNEVVFLLNEAGFSRKFVLKLNPKEK